MRQRGRLPPPHSSVNSTLVPSLLKVAECQKAKPGSVTASSRLGRSGSLMSKMMPLPEQAPAAILSDGNTVMSWHWSVTLVVCVPSP